MAGNADIAVGLLEAEASGDSGLVEELTGLVNDVYLEAERGLWQEGATRTTASELASLIEAGEIAVATWDGRIVGCVRAHRLSDDTGEFGMLVTEPSHRNHGVGLALVDFAERRVREHGLRVMQLELLVPREWRHPTKEFLTSWYGRLGYRHTRTGSIDATHPNLAPLLATPCDLQVHEKPLDAAAGAGPDLV